MKEIAEELIEMVAADQKARWDWNEIRRDKTVDEATVAQVKDEWNHVDAENLLRLETIFAEYGYPDVDRFGEKAGHAFWLLVQHCDQAPDFQIEVLAAMKSLLKTGSVSPGDYAYLYDRVHVNTGRLQRYGTQLRLMENGSGYESKPLESPESVDQRRKEMGLPPLAKYLTAHLKLFPTR